MARTWRGMSQAAQAATTTMAATPAHSHGLPVSAPTARAAAGTPRPARAPMRRTVMSLDETGRKTTPGGLKGSPSGAGSLGTLIRAP